MRPVLRASRLPGSPRDTVYHRCRMAQAIPSPRWSFRQRPQTH